MTTMQGIIRINATNAISQYDKMAHYSENFSNFNTNTYKVEFYHDVLKENGIVQNSGQRDFSKGKIARVNNPLNIAIDGMGFIPVTNAKGEIRYTRDGALTQNKDGILVTYNGDIVGGGIKLPVNYEKLEIRENGDVYTYKEKNGKPDFQGTIPIVVFPNQQGLKSIGGNNYVKTEESGEPELVGEHNRIAQYSIELSNTDLINEANNIMRVNTSMLATVSLMKVVDEMYERAVSLRS